MRMHCTMGLRGFRSVRHKDQCEILVMNTGRDHEDRPRKMWVRIRFEIRHPRLEKFAKILRRNWNLRKNALVMYIIFIIKMHVSILFSF